MSEIDPYQLPGTLEGSVSSSRQLRRRWWLGFVLGATPPAILGSYGYYSFQQFVASLPPGSAVCANPAVESIAVVVVVAPVCGAIFGMVARLLP